MKAKVEEKSFLQLFCDSEKWICSSSNEQQATYRRAMLSALSMKVNVCILIRNQREKGESTFPQDLRNFLKRDAASGSFFLSTKLHSDFQLFQVPALR